MSAQQAYVALDWIKGEIEETLRNAQHTLEAVAENAEDSTSMRSCLTTIHQVHGTLRMVELVSATQLAEEMEHLAQALMNSTVDDVGYSQEILMQAILQMTAYLEKIQKEQKDSPEIILPVINNLRACRGEEKLPGESDGGADQDARRLFVITGAGQEVLDSFDANKGQENIRKLRQRYQKSLIAVLKRESMRENLNLLAKVFGMVQKLCAGSSMDTLADLSLAVLEGVLAGAIKLDTDLSNYLKKIDVELKRVGEQGAVALKQPVEEALTNGLIARIEGATRETPRIKSIRDALASSASKAQQDTGASFGLDNATISAVARVLIDEIVGIKDKLDLFVRSSDKNMDDLAALIPGLEQVSKTIAMVGLDERIDSIQTHVDLLKTSISNNEQPDEDMLLGIAAALIGVEMKLGEYVGSTGDGIRSDAVGDVNEAQAAVIRETRSGLVICKDSIIDFISSGWDHQKIENLPKELLGLRGGLTIVSQQRASTLLLACARYAERALLKNKDIPELEDMDNLADAISGIDYFLERLLQNDKEPYTQMMDLAESSVEKLGFPVDRLEEVGGEQEAEDAAVEEAEEEAVEVATEEVSTEAGADEAEKEKAEPTSDEPLDAVAAETVVEEKDAVAKEVVAAEQETVEEESAKAVLAEDTVAPLAEDVEESEDEGDLIDDEIIEIFVEEAAEVQETIEKFFPVWQANLGDEEAEMEVRRAFHTLKGSGRMVGATVVGELAWSIENMLNRLKDNTIQVSPALVSMVEEVIEVIPSVVQAFEAKNQRAIDVSQLVARADELAAGILPVESAGPAEPQAEPAVEAEVTPLEPRPVTAEQEIELEEISIEADTELEEITLEEETSESEEIVLEEVSLEPAEGADLDLDLEEITLEEESESEEIVLEEVSLEPAEGADLDLDLEEITLEEESESEEIVLEEVSLEPAEGADLDVELEEITLEEETSEPEEIALEEISLEPAEGADLDVELEEITLEEESIAGAREEDSLELDEISIQEPEVEESDLEDELLATFAREAAKHLRIVGDFIDQASAESIAITGPLQSSLHTLKGSAAAAELTNISKIATPLERAANAIFDKNLQIEPEFTALLKRGSDLMETAIADLARYRVEEVEGTQAFLDNAEALIKSLTDQAVVEQDEQGFDLAGIKELLDADQILDAWNSDKLALLASELRRVVGKAETQGKPELGQLARAIADAYQRMDLSEKPDDATMALLKNAHETLVAMFDSMAANQETILDAQLVSRISRIGVGEEVAAKEDGIDELIQDSWDHLNNLGVALGKWRDDPGNLRELEQVIVHIGNIQKIARIGAFEPITEVCSAFVSFAETFSRHNRVPDNEDLELFGGSKDKISELLNALRAGVALEDDELEGDVLMARLAERVSLLDQLLAREGVEQVQAEGDQQATPAVTQAKTGDEVVDDIDEEILSIFIEEADEILESIDASILEWNDARDSRVPLDNLLRHLHTLKGGARLAGLNNLGEFSHNFETFLIGIQQSGVAVDDAFFGDLHSRQDEVTRRVEIYHRFAAGQATEEDLASARTTPVQQDAVPVAQATAPVTEEEEAKTEQQEPVEQKAEAAPAGTQEMVRVSAELLEDLISLAGESSITRGRVEQQISDFGSSLEELETTIDRVREQVRRLEIETESRETLFRARAGDDDSSFDELEMDRYTLLQEISRALTEATSDMMEVKDNLTNTGRDAETILHQQARIGSEMQEGLTRTRMVPFSRLIPRLRRIVRQISGELSKSVRFDAYNVEGEIDRSVLDRIVAPLEHMLRNAVDHGIESAEERKAANKPEMGRISLRLSREGGYFVIQISDDGGGIPIDAVRAKAIESGLITESSELSDQEVMQFIMNAGFTTAQKLTQISGRGVGMDVVGSEIKQLGGTVTIDSTQGIGSEFIIRIPFTVSINRALMVVVREETYAVPLNTIEGIVRVSPYELEAYYQPDAPMFEYAGQPYRLSYMGRVLDRADNPNLEGQVSPLPVILARSGDHAIALQVDRVIGSRDVVVKSLGPQFSDVGGVSGATILGDGSVVVILDVMARARAAEAQDEVQAVEEEAAPSEHVRKVMIVDDSVTVRKVTSRLIERQGWEVMTAKDGLDAINQLQDVYPDVMLLDIEMPRMDGFEVLRAVRHEERLKELPIIMITSRTGEKHMQQALDLGVNRYLGKPFQEANLLSTIEEVLAEVKRS